MGGGGTMLDRVGGRIGVGGTGIGVRLTAGLTFSLLWMAGIAAPVLLLGRCRGGRPLLGGSVWIGTFSFSRDGCAGMRLGFWGAFGDVSICPFVSTRLRRLRGSGSAGMGSGAMEDWRVARRVVVVVAVVDEARPRSS